MRSKCLLKMSLLISFLCFIYNLFINLLYFLSIAKNHHQQYCQSCTEICGVWKCIHVALGESTKRIEISDVQPFIVASAGVNIIMGLLAMAFLLFGMMNKEAEEKTSLIDLIESTEPPRKIVQSGGHGVSKSKL